MKDQSVAKSALDKLNKIEECLQDLFASAKIIKQLEDKFKIGLNNHEEKFTACETQHQALTKSMSSELSTLNETSNLLKQNLDRLIIQKDQLTQDIESYLVSYTEKKQEIDDALKILLSDKQDCNQLNTNIKNAFEGLDQQIEDKLLQYEKLLESNKSLLQDEFIQLRDNAHQDILNLKNTLKSEFNNLLNSAFVYATNTLSNKITKRLDEIEQKQTQFIERQTALIDNNTQQVDQLQRTLRMRQENMTQDIKSIQEHVQRTQKDSNDLILIEINKLREELRPAKKRGFLGFGKRT